MKYLLTNEAEKSTGGSLTSKTAFCNEVRVQFKLNVKTKLQLRESLSAGNILNVEENFNFMTVVVRFQLIILKKIKYISFRDLSPNRPFQELTK